MPQKKGKLCDDILCILIFVPAQAFVSNKMGRSTSHGGLPRGGGRMGRRTSMAF